MIDLSLLTVYCGKVRNLDDFAAASRGTLQTGPRNLAKFSAENCGP